MATVELYPSPGWDGAPVLQAVRQLRVAGGDAVNLVDPARGQTRMNVISTAVLAEREVGIETIVPYT